MAAPAVQARGVPLGAHIRDGFKSKFALGILPTFSIWEFEITPMMLDGGEPIPQSTFFNTLWHTFAPQKLIKVGSLKIKGEYDPDVLKPAQLPLIINAETNATLLWPNLCTISVWGYLKSATFGVLKEGTLPEIDIEFVVTNWDITNHTEAGPSYVDNSTGTADV